MNRNVLKIIAVLSMLIDHVGIFFFDNNFVFRLIGRIAFPIFAFFIAEGLKHTHSKKKYVLTLLICALISQVPYAFLHNFYNFNILFTFLLAIFCIYLIETYKKHDILSTICLSFTLCTIFILSLFNFIDYGLFGVLLVVVFYFFSGKLKWILSSLVLVLLSLESALLSGFTLFSFIQFASLLSLALLAFYNGEKGRLKLKYFFYVFYPLHLAVICLITLI